MKKIVLSISLLASVCFAQAQSTWKMGLTLGAVGNHSSFSGGDEIAHARFHHNNLGSGLWGLNFRKTYTDHWSLQAGIHFSETGFQFALTENYSLLTKKGHYTTNEVRAGVVSLPVSVLYHFKPNCKNVRWYLGAGISLNGNNAPSTVTNNVVPEGEQVSNGSAVYLLQTSTASAHWALNGNLLCGVEKTFNSGRIFGIGFIANAGFTPIMKTTVHYSMDNQDYTHSFTNFGNYFGIQASYYFRNFGSGKAAMK